MASTRVTTSGISVLCLVLAAGAFPTLGKGPVLQLDFAHEVQNLRFVRQELRTRIPDGTYECPTSGETFFGTIPHRYVGEPLTSSLHQIPFVVAYSESPGVPELWSDLDNDQRISCEERISLVAHPHRSDRVLRTLTISWAEDGAPRRTQRYRLILPSRLETGSPPEYSLELVDVPVARQRIAEIETLWILFDGNHDGRIDGRAGDALLIDATGSRRIDLDPTGENFHSLHLPLDLPWGSYRVSELDPNGPSLTLTPQDQRRPDEPARGDSGYLPSIDCPNPPEGPLRLGGDVGKPQLIYFWLAGCGSCAVEVGKLNEALAALGTLEALRVVGVSLNEDHEDFEQFVAEHDPAWPQCFAGAMLWDNPVAAHFGVYQPSSTVVLDARGRVVHRGQGIFESWAILREMAPELPELAVPSPLTEEGTRDDKVKSSSAP